MLPSLTSPQFHENDRKHSQLVLDAAACITWLVRINLECMACGQSENAPKNWPAATSLLSIFHERSCAAAVIWRVVGFAGCTVSNCQVAVHVSEDVEVIMRNNDLSFNDVAMCFMGYGIIEENIVWGNLHRSSLGTSGTVLSNSELVGISYLGPICL